MPKPQIVPRTPLEVARARVAGALAAVQNAEDQHRVAVEALQAAQDERPGLLRSLVAGGEAQALTKHRARVAELADHAEALTLVVADARQALDEARAEALPLELEADRQATAARVAAMRETAEGQLRAAYDAFGECCRALGRLYVGLDRLASLSSRDGAEVAGALERLDPLAMLRRDLVEVIPFGAGARWSVVALAPAIPGTTSAGAVDVGTYVQAEDRAAAG